MGDLGTRFGRAIRRVRWLRAALLLVMRGGLANAFFLLVGGVLAGAVWARAEQAAASADWPRVRGEVVEVRVVERRTRTFDTRRTHYEPLVRYRYRVNGKLHFSERIFFHHQHWSRDEALELLKPYRKGAEVDVFYDPSDQGSAVLQSGRSDPMDGAILVALVVALVAGIRFARRVRRTKNLPRAQTRYRS